MRSYQITDAFGLDHLTLVERPDPVEPGHGQVRVRMRAVSLNYRDLLMVRGHYNPRQPLPLVPCSDGAGVVEAVGPGVSRWQVGDRVMGIFAQDWIDGDPDAVALRSTLGGPLNGTLTEVRNFSEHGLVATPDYLSDVEAATLPCAALTAWSAMATYGDVKAGDTVLTLGTGGVSIFAVQLARAMGARVIVTSSSDDKLERARELGAHEGVNYRTHERWSDQVLELTDGRGVDHVIEVGGAGTLDQSVRSVRPGGHIALIGVLAGGADPVHLTRVLMRNIRIQGILVGSRAGFEAMNRALSVHRVQPVVDRVFDFGEARAAFDHLASGSHLGKVVIRIGDDT